MSRRLREHLEGLETAREASSALYRTLQDFEEPDDHQAAVEAEPVPLPMPAPLRCPLLNAEQARQIMGEP